MRVGELLNALAKHAPIIAVFALIAAVVGAWARAPDWLFDSLAVLVGSAALLLWLVKALPRQRKSPKDLGFTRNRDFFAYEFTGKGRPRGFYRLGVLGILTVFATDFMSPYGKLAFAAFGLTVVWGIVNKRYPADREALH